LAARWDHSASIHIFIEVQPHHQTATSVRSIDYSRRNHIHLPSSLKHPSFISDFFFFESNKRVPSVTVACADAAQEPPDESFDEWDDGHWHMTAPLNHARIRSPFIDATHVLTPLNGLLSMFIIQSTLSRPLPNSNWSGKHDHQRHSQHSILFFPFLSAVGRMFFHCNQDAQSTRTRITSHHVISQHNTHDSVPHPHNMTLTVMTLR